MDILHYKLHLMKKGEIMRGKKRNIKENEENNEENKQKEEKKKRKKFLRAGFEPATYGLLYHHYSPPLYQLSYRRTPDYKSTS